MIFKELISIIIPVYNSASSIVRCLDSIYNQESKYNIEVIVIDDGSTDSTIDKLTKHPQSLNIIRQENKGPAAARNRGIEAATGEYLAFLDADDYWLPGFLDHTVAFLEQHPEAIAVSVGQQHHLPSGQVAIAPAMLTNQHDLKPMVLDDFFAFWAAHNHVCTGSILMRTAVVKQTGGQREDFRITEDLEFWAYLATFGKFGFIPEILFVSDGIKVTKEKGWWKKNIIRWNTAPTIEVWENRILSNKPSLIHNKGYLMCRGRICRNLSYAMIMSGRRDLARQSITNNYNYLPNDLLSNIIMKASVFGGVFNTLCFVLVLREKLRRV